ncbi:hypothetical protein [Novosphingobium sp.]|uniref:hypothetical protein n=1 Tax=Novosphingobium sp. TaxID=1874826 RepID=UPI003BA8BD4F
MKTLRDSFDDWIDQDDEPRTDGAESEIAGQRPAFPISDPADWRGRVVTIIATARGPGGAQAQRRVVAEITGNPRQPYVLRWGA